MKWYRGGFKPTNGIVRHPLNAEGDFYSLYEQCTLCGAPEAEAKGLMGHDEQGCYFIRQPETAEELDGAIQAVAVSCIAGLRYAGTERQVIQKLHDLGCGDACDEPLVDL